MLLGRAGAGRETTPGGQASVVEAPSTTHIQEFRSPMVCRGCNHEHDPLTNCAVARRMREWLETKPFASNTASNKVTASNNASNREVLEEDRDGAIEDRVLGAVREAGGGFWGGVGGVEINAGEGARSGEVDQKQHQKQHQKQRWSREAYNAYQREYMRKVRAK
jgi:hypothetical protein